MINKMISEFKNNGLCQNNFFSAYVTLDGKNYDVFLGGSWIEVHETRDTLQEWGEPERESDCTHIGNYHCNSLDFSNTGFYGISENSNTAKLIKKVILTKPRAIISKGILTAYHPDTDTAQSVYISNMVEYQSITFSFNDVGEISNITVLRDLYDNEDCLADIYRVKALRNYYISH
ncbi:hypothetical protein [Aeromonas hydrophila]|uniref:hypothetical protein n=1 Tax=Aeromonas hydrophila TaxID=644 RepID=UPI003EC9064D